MNAYLNNKLTHAFVKEGILNGNKIQNTLFKVSIPGKKLDRTSKTGDLHFSVIIPGQPQASKITVPHENAVEFITYDTGLKKGYIDPLGPPIFKNDGTIETEEETLTRIRSAFDDLKLMVKGIGNGQIRGLVVYGPPGLGKTYEIEEALKQTSLFDRLQYNPEDDEGRRSNLIDENEIEPDGWVAPYLMFKGYTTAIGLYETLYDYKGKKDVVVFDDCDSALGNEDSCNILKAALDTSKKRILSYRSERRGQDKAPNRFLYNGGIIFITNVNFEKEISEGKRKNLTPHLEAIQSRCFVLNLPIETMRERFLRVVQVVNDSKMLQERGLDETQEKEVLAYLKKNCHRLREVSLRSAIQVSDLMQVSQDHWERLSEGYVIRKEMRDPHKFS